MELQNRGIHGEKKPFLSYLQTWKSQRIAAELIHFHLCSDCLTGQTKARTRERKYRVTVTSTLLLTNFSTHREVTSLNSWRRFWFVFVPYKSLCVYNNNFSTETIPVPSPQLQLNLFHYLYCWNGFSLWTRHGYVKPVSLNYILTPFSEI